MDNTEKKLLALVALVVFVPFTTTLLLDWVWVQARAVRQILVYALIAFEIFVFAKNIYTVAKRKE